jgi:hypothetical protein
MVKDVKKVDVVRHNPRTTETVGDDGTLDSDYLRTPRRYKWNGERKPMLSMSFISADKWASIFCKDEGMCSSHDEVG